MGRNGGPPHELHLLRCLGILTMGAVVPAPVAVKPREILSQKKAALTEAVLTLICKHSSSKSLLAR